MLLRASGRSRCWSIKHKPSTSFLSRVSFIGAMVIVLTLVSVYGTLAAISLSTSVPYTENFDSLGIPATNPAPSTLPVDFRVDTQSVPRLIGIYFFASNQTQRVAGANMPDNAEDGAYNLGAGTATLGNEDRAVGFLSSATSTQSGNLYAELQNNTGGALNGVQISYDVEKYRNGTNPAGYRVQLFYSSDGLFWSSAGPNFLTTFGPDANNDGFATAPGAVVSIVNQPLDVTVANGSRLYLAWNYSVASGDTTTNAQSLAIDNISIVGVAPVTPTNPTGIGVAAPAAVALTESTLLTVAVTPGANPTGTSHIVTGDLSSIGGSAAQMFFDDGSNGDLIPADNIFTFAATVAGNTALGNKALPFTVSDSIGRSSTGAINLTVLQLESGPSVLATDPANGNANAPYDSTITVDFSEPVEVVGNWFDINCSNSGQHNSATVASYNNFQGYQITPNAGFQFGEQCTVTLFRSQIHDLDLEDIAPNTDSLVADYVFSFNVVAAGAPAPHPPSVHLTMGNPSNAVADLAQPNNYLMERPGYSLSYNRDRGTPNWVSWHLDQDWTGSSAQVETFRTDPAVPSHWYRVQSTDYLASGFDRGQMTPGEDRNNGTRLPVNQETYLMTNMLPQSPDNNQGPWADLESDLRAFLNGSQNEIYVVSGPSGAGGSGTNGGVTNTVANGRVTVPAFTWKVALIIPRGENDPERATAAARTIAVLIPNVQGIRNNSWEQYLTTVDAIEDLTGYDFFSSLPNAVENAVEAGINGSNPPGTGDQSESTVEDTPLAITLNAVSPLASPTFTSTVLSGPSHGTLAGTGLNVTYTPATNFNGSDSFTFRVNDGNQNSNISTVNITVAPVNDRPAANSQSVSTNRNTSVGITLTGSDLETPGANLVFNVTAGPSHGSLSGSGASRTYTPATNYSGPDSFRFTVTDAGALTSVEATVSINVVAGDLTFNLSVNPTTVKRGRSISLTASYSNQTGSKQKVKFKIRYASPCCTATIGNIGPISIPKGAHGSATLPFPVPRNACTGLYSLTLEAYVGGVLKSTTTATLTVTP